MDLFYFEIINYKTKLKISHLAGPKTSHYKKVLYKRTQTAAKFLLDRQLQQRAAATAGGTLAPG